MNGPAMVGTRCDADDVAPLAHDPIFSMLREAP